MERVKDSAYFTKLLQDGHALSNDVMDTLKHNDIPPSKELAAGLMMLAARVLLMGDPPLQKSAYRMMADISYEMEMAAKKGPGTHIVMANSGGEVARAVLSTTPRDKGN